MLYYSGTMFFSVDFGEILEKRKRELESKLAVLEAPVASRKPEESAEFINDFGKFSLLKENSEEELVKVNDALDRWRNGTFGICSICLLKIPQARLEVVPQARHCCSCAKSKKFLIRAHR